MPRCTGIQILEHGVRAVTLKGSPKAVRLAGVAQSRIEDAEGLRDVGAAVRRALQDNRLPRDPAYLALPVSGMKVRRLTMPFQGAEQIRKTVHTVMEEQLHGFPVEDAFLVFHKLRDLEDGSSRVLALAAEKTVLRTVLDDLQKRGVDPQGVEPDLGALYAFAKHAGAFPDEGTALLLDLEPERTGILTVRDGVLQSVRAVRLRLGPGEDGSATADEPGASPEDAPPEADGVPPSAAGARDPEAGDKLAREIERTVMAEGWNEPPGGAWVSGSLSADETLLASLSERAGFPFERLPRPPGFEDAPPWVAAAAGAALKAFGKDPLGYDFRQEELAFRRKFERVQGGLTVLSILLFLVFLVLGLHLGNLSARASEEHKKIAQTAVNRYNQTDVKEPLQEPKVHNATKMVYDQLMKKLGQLTDLGVDKDVPQIDSALSRWRELALRIEGASGVEYLTVREILLEPRLFVLRGKVDSPPAVDSLLNVVKANPGFEKAGLGTPPKVDEGKVEYHITAEIE